MQLISSYKISCNRGSFHIPLLSLPTGCYNETQRGAELSSRSPPPGGPFSALAASMQPVLANERPDQSEDPNSQPEYTWDEFGFRVEEEDGPEDSSNKLLSIPFVESPKVDED